jgi:aspartyl-tRNA(Asn)/glutamyl-tRNA(Gln) amidotransferase subunit A
MGGDDAVSDPADLSAVELLDAYKKRALSPVEATRAVLDRIARRNPELNAYNLIDADGALESARKAEARWAQCQPHGPLDGVPVSIKDILLTKGWPTLRGSRLIDAKQPWTEDAPCTARLREAGAVIVGKTTSPEFGWKALGDSPLTGITRNPWDLSRTPGGSSAGAAAAVAAGLAPLAVGTDGGGSIRIPCSFTGIFGIKPTFGRVPAYPPSAFGVVAHVGPMTRTVADAALMLDVLSGYDDRDPWAVPGRPSVAASLDAGVKGLRIAYSPTLGYARVDAQVRVACDRAAQVFAELGAKVEAADPGFASPRDAFLTLWSSGAAKVVSAFPASEYTKMDPGLLATARLGQSKSALDWLAADTIRAELGQTMIAFHRTYDLLLTPAVAVPALPVGQDLNDPRTESHWIDWTPFSYPFNLTRQPGASLPCGRTSGGLPIGLQIVGRLHEDALVLRAARAFETARPFPHPPGQ